MLAVSMSTPVAPVPKHMSGPLSLSEKSSHSKYPTINTNSSNLKRPKLSLQTNSLSTNFGGASRAATNGTATAKTIATPTTANTYANTWDLTIRPSPVSRSNSPRPFPSVRTQSPSRPYHVSLPFGVKPILKNSPLIDGNARSAVSPSPRDSRRRVFFPLAKKVVFKRHLEEVIETTQYTARHSDLTSSSEDESSGSDECQASSQASQVARTDGRLTSPPPTRKRKGRRDSGVSITATDSENGPAKEPQRANVTPRADRKRRRWEWTLDPVGKKPIGKSTSYSDDLHEPLEEVPRPGEMSAKQSTELAQLLSATEVSARCNDSDDDCSPDSPDRS